jgi:hypothetical protein
LNFNDLKAGQYVHDDLWYTHGVKITAILKSNHNAQKGFTPILGEHVEAGGGAMVFDTSKPTKATGQSDCAGYGLNDGDADLGAPNIGCPGCNGSSMACPGTGFGGDPYLRSNSAPHDFLLDSKGNKQLNPSANCEPLGNILVIQEANTPCPDDNSEGGWIEFDFRFPTEVKLAKLLDIDWNENTPIITVTHGNSKTTVIQTQKTGDNGLWNQPIGLTEVTKVSIKYHGSGGIAELLYRYCVPTCPLYTLNFSELPAGSYITDEKWDEWGVKVKAVKFGNKGFTPSKSSGYRNHVGVGGGAMVFDAAHPTKEDGQLLCTKNRDGDADLGSPNEYCASYDAPGTAGPGKGCGGSYWKMDNRCRNLDYDAWGNKYKNRYANCEPAGKILIIQEENKTCPDDSSSGGWIEFEFKNPQTAVQLAKVLDTDESNTPQVTVFYGNGQKETYLTDATGENGLFSQSVLKDAVTKISIRYFGSGSVDEIQYSLCP